MFRYTTESAACAKGSKYHYHVDAVDYDGWKGWQLARRIDGILQDVWYFRTEREARVVGIEWLVAMGETSCHV